MSVLAAVFYLAIVLGPVVWLQRWLMAGSNLEKIKDRARLASVWPIIITAAFVCLELVRKDKLTITTIALAWAAVWLVTLLLARPTRWWVHR